MSVKSKIGTNERIRVMEAFHMERFIGNEYRLAANYIWYAGLALMAGIVSAVLTLIIPTLVLITTRGLTWPFLTMGFFALVTTALIGLALFFCDLSEELRPKSAPIQM